MENNRSKEDCLERFLILEERGIEKIRAKDIVCSFSYSRASVSVAMKKLAEENLIKIDENSYITLTEKGRDIASSVYKRHKMLTSFLMMIGVDEKQKFLKNSQIIYRNKIKPLSFFLSLEIY